MLKSDHVNLKRNIISAHNGHIGRLAAAEFLIDQQLGSVMWAAVLAEEKIIKHFVTGKTASSHPGVCEQKWDIDP